MRIEKDSAASSVPHFSELFRDFGTFCEQLCVGPSLGGGLGIVRVVLDSNLRALLVRSETKKFHQGLCLKSAHVLYGGLGDLSGCHSMTFAEAVTKEVVQLRDSFDFLHGCFYIVGYSAEPHGLAICNHVTTTRIVVAWLSNAPHIDHDFLIGQGVMIADLVRAKELQARREDTGNVRMSLKANSGDE